MSAWLINSAGLLLMAGIVWWFWLAGDGNTPSNDDHH